MQRASACLVRSCRTQQAHTAYLDNLPGEIGTDTAPIRVAKTPHATEPGLSLAGSRDATAPQGPLLQREREAGRAVNFSICHRRMWAVLVIGARGRTKSRSTPHAEREHTLWCTATAHTLPTYVDLDLHAISPCGLPWLRCHLILPLPSVRASEDHQHLDRGTQESVQSPPRPRRPRRASRPGETRAGGRVLTCWVVCSGLGGRVVGAGISADSSRLGLELCRHTGILHHLAGSRRGVSSPPARATPHADERALALCKIPRPQGRDRCEAPALAPTAAAHTPSLPLSPTTQAT